MQVYIETNSPEKKTSDVKQVTGSDSVDEFKSQLQKLKLVPSTAREETRTVLSTFSPQKKVHAHELLR